MNIHMSLPYLGRPLPDLVSIHAFCRQENRPRPFVLTDLGLYLMIDIPCNSPEWILSHSRRCKIRRHVTDAIRRIGTKPTR
jgi:hypothetical protein